MHFIQKSLQIGASLLFSTAVMQANEVGTIPESSHLTKTQKQIQQYVTETLLDLGVASEHSTALDPRETLGVSNKTSKSWSILNLLETNMTGNTANDHAIHLFGDRMNAFRSERRRQVNHLITALNEVYYRILVNQSVVRTLGIRLIDFFNDSLQGIDCDEKFQQNAKHFLDVVNKTFHSPAFKLPFEAKDLRDRNLLYYFPNYEPDNGEGTSQCDDCDFLSPHLDLNGHALTLTGTYQVQSLCSRETEYQLLETMIVHCLRNGDQERIFTGMISDTGNAGTLAVTGGSHVLNTEAGSVVQNLNLTGGVLTLGGEGDGALSVGGSLEIAEGSVLKVGSEGGSGMVTVTGTTTNNGRVEIYKTKDGSPAKFGAYTGTGNTYISEGSTMEVAFDTGSDSKFLNYSGNFEGKGNLILSGTNNNWENMGTGVLESLTVNGSTRWGQIAGAKPIVVEGNIELNAYFGNCQTTAYSLICGSLTIERSYIDIINGATVTCRGEFCQNSTSRTHMYNGGYLFAKICTLNKGDLSIGSFSSGENTFSIQETMWTAGGTMIWLGHSNYTDRSGTLTVGSVLTHNGIMEIGRLTDAESLVFGGLEGSGTIEIKETLNPMIISPTTDCAFLGQITGAGTVNIAGSAIQAFDNPNGSTLQTLNIRSGTAAVGNTQAGQLTIPGTLNIDANGIFKVGSESATGTVTVTGPTTNNGRVEIVKTADGSPTKFGAYQGSGNTYIAPGATMEVAFDSTLSYSGNFEGEGNLVLSGANNRWEKMGSGTLGALTVNGYSVLGQASGAQPIKVKGEVRVNAYLGVGSNELSSACSITCNSLTTEGNGYFHLYRQGSHLTCLGEIVQNSNYSSQVYSGGTLTTNTYILNKARLYIGYGSIGTGTVTVQDTMSTASGTVVQLGENGKTDRSGKLTVGGVLTHNGTIDVYRLTDENSLIFGGLEGEGTINLNDTTNPMTINFTRDCMFTGKITGAATLNLHSATPVTFAWSQRSAFKGTVNKDDTVTIICSADVDLAGQTLTLTGGKEEEIWCPASSTPVQLSEAKTVGFLTSDPGEISFNNMLMDTSNSGTLAITGGTHTFCTSEGSTVNTLNVAEGSVFQVGNASVPGSFEITGTTTNNGRVEIVKTKDSSPAKFGEYQGNGNTYIAKGATMEVAFDTGSSNNALEYSGNFEGEGNLVLSGARNYWKNMGSGTLGSLTVNGQYTHWNQSSGSKPIEIKGEIRLNSYFQIGQEAPCSITCDSLTTEGSGYFYLCGRGSQLICHGEIVQHSRVSSHVYSGGALTTKSYSLNQSKLYIGHFLAGTDTITIQETMSTASGTWVHLGAPNCTDRSGKLTVGGVLTHNGTMDVYCLTDENSLVFGGLEGSGTINFYETNTQPMTINFTRDCEFTGPITGSGIINLRSETPVTFIWPQRNAFTGTVNKDDTVTIIYQSTLDLSSKMLTLTGAEADSELLVTPSTPKTLSADTTSRSLANASGQTDYWGKVLDTGSAGTLSITGGTHTVNTEPSSAIQNINLTGGTLAVGEKDGGTLAVGGTLNVASGSAFKVGSESATGIIEITGAMDIKGTLDIARKGILKLNGASSTVTGTTTNNGRIEIVKTLDGSPAKFGEYQGTGNTYIAKGATMEVAFDTGSSANYLEYSGNFEGEGNLVLSGTRNYWKNMGSGTLSSLTVNGWTYWLQSSWSNPIEIKGEMRLNAFLSGNCAFTCQSLITEGQGGFDVRIREGFIICLGEIVQNSQMPSYVEFEGTVKTKVYTLNRGTLDIGNNCYGIGRVIVQDTMSTANGTTILLGELRSTSYGKLTVGGVLTHNGTMNVYRLTDSTSLMFGGLEGAGTINLHDTTNPITINFTRDCTFTGPITGSGIINLRSATPVTFTWPQRWTFEGTVNKDDTVTIVCSADVDLAGQTLTLTGGEEEEIWRPVSSTPVQLSEAKTVGFLTSDPGEISFNNMLMDTSNSGTLAITGGTHTFCTSEGSTVNTLNVAEGSVFQVGNASVPGSFEITGTTTNNGRVEIHTTPNGFPAKFGAYQGSGNTYIAKGATMEVAFDTESSNNALEYSGNFEGEGNLVLSGANNTWKNMGSGTLGSLTVNGDSHWGQAARADSIEIKGEVRLNACFEIGCLSPCSITCNSLTTEGNGYFHVFRSSSHLTCLGEIVQNSESYIHHIYNGGVLITKNYSLAKNGFYIGYYSSGTGTVVVQDTMSTANRTTVCLGHSSDTNRSGKLTVGGVLTHNGTMNVYHLTDSTSLVFGGLEGGGTINLQDTTNPMIINLTRDCEFTGKIAGAGSVNIVGSAIQFFDTQKGLTIQTLNIQSGTAAVGNFLNSQLTIPGALNIDANGIFKVGGQFSTGTVTIPGPTTNYGRVEILNTPDRSPAKFGEYQGTGNTYIAKGATMEVAFESSDGIEYSGYIEGEGNLVLSGSNNHWKNMGGGKLGSLTVNGWTYWHQSSGTTHFEIKGEMRLNALLSGNCSFSCRSLITEGQGGFDVRLQDVYLICSGEIVQNSQMPSYVEFEGTVSTKVYTLNRGTLDIGNNGYGIGRVTVQETMSTASGTTVQLGHETATDRSGKLTIGGILTHNGTMDVYKLTDSESLVFGGLTGTGTINLYDTTNPMTINFTQDYTFTGQITGSGIINLRSETPVTFIWLQRKLFTGTVNKDDTVTILEALVVNGGDSYTLEESKAVLYIASFPVWGTTLNLQDNTLTLVGGNFCEEIPTFFGLLNGMGGLILARDQQNLDTDDGSSLGRLTVSSGILTIGSSQEGYLFSEDFYIEPEGVVVVGTVGGAQGHLTVGDHVYIDGQLKILNGTLTTQPWSYIDGHFCCSGNIFVGEQATFLFIIEYADITTDMQITGSGTVVIRTESYSDYFLWSTRKLFTGTVITEGNVRIICSSDLDLRGQTLTLTGVAEDERWLPISDIMPVELSMSKTVGFLTSDPVEISFDRKLMDTGNAGTLAITGGTHILNTEADSSVQTLNVSGGNIVIGSEATGTLATSNVSVQDGVLGVGSVDHADSKGHLTVSGNLEIGEDGVVKIGDRNGEGILSVAGTTTNNGRVEIHKTADDSPAKFGAYQGSGNTYIAPGATMEVAFDTGSSNNALEYSGNFEGEGNLVLSGANNTWKNMGSGTLGSLTVNGRTRWTQATSATPIIVKGTAEFNQYFDTAGGCSITCDSMIINGSQNFGIFEKSNFRCSGEVRINSSGSFYIMDGGTLFTKIQTLNNGLFDLGHSGANTVTVQETMSTASGTEIVLGRNGVTDRSSKLTVGGVLTHNGTMNVWHLTNTESLMFGGLEGAGTINLNDTENPMTINFTQDCTFTGQITGSGIINLHSTTPVTFIWLQRNAFTGTVNKDNTVTILES